MGDPGREPQGGATGPVPVVAELRRMLHPRAGCGDEVTVCGGPQWRGQGLFPSPRVCTPHPRSPSSHRTSGSGPAGGDSCQQLLQGQALALPWATSGGGGGSNWALEELGWVTVVGGESLGGLVLLPLYPEHPPLSPGRILAEDSPESSLRTPGGSVCPWRGGSPAGRGQKNGGGWVFARKPRQHGWALAGERQAYH